MKKIIYLLIIGFTLYSCSNNEIEPRFEFEIFSITEAKTPTSFTFGTIDTVTVKYKFPNGCYRFRSLYYEYQDTTRVVAINAIIDLDAICAQETEEKELKIPIQVFQEENYLFKFFKGKDADGKNIFEEIEVPVN